MVPSDPPLLEARRLSKQFSGWGRGSEQAATVRAVDDVDLRLDAGEALAIVGESGSGKTTLGRLLIRLLEPTSGELRFEGQDLLALRGARLRRRRRDFQMVFQDPFGSLNPRLTVEQTVAEPLRIHRLIPRRDRPQRVRELLDMVGLPATAAGRYPHEFSGGQRQRIGIARALATQPKLLVADEPVSSLDVSVQAQIINLLAGLRVALDLTVVFIGHDLAVVEQLADRVAVMYLGRVVEQGPAARIFATPQHPYTVCLLSAVPAAVPRNRRSRIVLAGEPPDPSQPPSGCRFHPRCPIARPRCAVEEPALVERPGGVAAACHFPGELSARDARDAQDGIVAGGSANFQSDST